MLGDQLRAYALASAMTLTPTGEVGAPSGGVGRSAGVPLGTVSISAPVVMVLPMAGIMRSTSQKAPYVAMALTRTGATMGNPPVRTGFGAHILLTVKEIDSSSLDCLFIGWISPAG